MRLWEGRVFFFHLCTGELDVLKIHVLVGLIHLIYGGFQAFGLLRVSVTQRMARALSFIVYSSNTLIVLLFLSLYRLCFVVDLKISLFWVFLFYSHTQCFSFNRLALWSHSTFHQSSLNLKSPVPFFKAVLQMSIPIFWCCCTFVMLYKPCI